MSLAEPVRQRLLVLDSDRTFAEVAALVGETEGFEPMVEIEHARLATHLAGVDGVRPDIVILDFAVSEDEALELVDTLAAAKFAGVTIVLHGRDGDLVKTVRELAKNYGVKIGTCIEKPARIVQIEGALKNARAALAAAAAKAPAKAGQGAP
ncbi:MAG: hypothetical protein JNK11_19890 [Alphaproteobacteria bacterium]|nr:hypothetical protein [Alphaproteobacteria bacterium]